MANEFDALECEDCIAFLLTFASGRYMRCVAERGAGQGAAKHTDSGNH